jgi:hypothetical protein
MSKNRSGAAMAANTPKKRRGPGVPFKKGGDERQWRHGCKSKAQLNTEIETSKLFAKIGSEEITVTNMGGRQFKASNLEALVRVFFSKGLAGDITAGKEILDRVLGKATQPISGGLDLNVSMTMDTLLKSFKEYESAGA